MKSHERGLTLALGARENDMKGVIRYINHPRGMVAVFTEEGSYSVFELLGDAAFIGDGVSWAGDTPLGSELLINHTQNERYDVYFQNHHVYPLQLKRQLLIE